MPFPDDRNMIDIHCHMLPGLDDGPATMDEAVAMARLAVADGIVGVLCTPHWHPMIWPNEREGILQAVARLRTRLAGEAVPLQVWAGSELSLDPDLDSGLMGGRLCTLNGGPWVLLELPGQGDLSGLDDRLAGLRKQGRHVVLAHPERYAFVRRDPARLHAWVAMGVAVQITASGLLGRSGPETAALCRRLLEHRLVHFLASDGHGARTRRPALRQAVEAATGIIGERDARRLVKEHPAAVLRGEALDLAGFEPRPIAPRKRSWLGSLLG
jgi:protein-tyrosine phosphatase